MKSETTFQDFNALLVRLNLAKPDSESGILILNLKDISERSAEEFSLYRNDFYEVNIVNKQRKFRFTVDGTKYQPTGKPYICFISPNRLQSYRVVGDFTEAEGFYLFFSKAFLGSIKRYNSVNFFERRWEPFYTLSEADYLSLFSWLSLVSQELDQSSLAQRRSVAEHLIAVFLLKTESTIRVKKSAFYDRPQKIADNFLDLVRTSDRPQTVAHFAGALALTTKSLNTITKKVLGKTAKQVVKDNLIQKASALLVQSILSISEISSLLGFEEVSHFSRFFKNETLLTPKEFRRQSVTK